jgi:predicted nucleic acid-binding protein
MKATMIIDCSVTMAWCFDDEATPATTGLLNRLKTEAFLVPGLWYLEVTNVLLVAERRQRISTTESSEFLGQLSSLKVEVEDEVAERAFLHIMPLCRRYGLTTYDARYLELSARRQMPLATLDKELRAAAKSLGVELLGV